jgi:glutathione S-transferase
MTGSTERILHLTPQSHFSRKVRIVLQELGLPCELAHVPDLLSDDPAKFGGNPILRVPVLQDGPTWVIESDAIVRYLLETYDAGRDRFSFFGMNVPQRNALSIVSAIMGAEVELLLSRRSGLVAEHAGTYFRRHREVIGRGLAWLEANGPRFWPEPELSYLDIALLCMWDHLRYNKLGDESVPCPWTEARTAKYASRPSVAGTSPEAMQALQWDLYPSQRPREPR